MAIDWRKYGLIVRSKNKAKIMSNLDNPRTPVQLTQLVGIDKATISKGLSKLVSLGLVKCLNPDLRMGKVYALTGEGEKLLKQLRESDVSRG